MEDRSRSTSATDFAVHLNCLSDAEQYDNKSSYFTNNMNPPILLPFHTPYEVALSNIYFKEDFYLLLANDEESCIQIVFYILKDSSLSSSSDSEKPTMLSGSHVQNDLTEIVVVDNQKIVDKVYPSINLIDEIKTIIEEYNNQFEFPLLLYDELNMKIKYDLTEKHLIHLIHKHSLHRADWFASVTDDDKYGAMALKFGRKIANYFGYYPNKPFFLYCESNKLDLNLLNALITKPSFSFESEKSNPISNIFVYTNIVKRSRTGSQNTNLLEVIPFNTFSKTNSITIYKEVSQFDIQYIKIQLTDEYGKNIPFLDNTYVAVELHFRPKI